jgi:hypothetical protein
MSKPSQPMLDQFLLNWRHPDPVSAIFLVLPKLDGCQVDLPNCWSCSKFSQPSSNGLLLDINGSCTGKKFILLKFKLNLAHIEYLSEVHVPLV